MFFKIAQKVTKYLGCFCKKICNQNVTKYLGYFCKKICKQELVTLGLSAYEKIVSKCF